MAWQKAGFSRRAAENAFACPGVTYSLSAMIPGRMGAWGSLATRITLRTNFTVPGKENDSLALDSNVDTLSCLLSYLGEKIRFDFIDPHRGELETDLEILVNGKDFRFLPGGIDALIKEGDLVEVYLLPLGGG